MRRVIATALVTTILLGVVGVTGAAGAGTRPTATRKYFLHIDIPQQGVGGSFVQSLSILDRPDEGSGSANVYDGLPNEMFIATGAREPATTRFPSVDGGPLRLNANSPVTGVIAFEAFAATLDDTPIPVGGGAATLELQLTGKLSSGKKVAIGEQQIDYLVTPVQETYLLEVDLAPSSKVHGERFSSITLTTLIRGPSAMSGAFELDDPASFIEVPTL